MMYSAGIVCNTACDELIPAMFSHCYYITAESNNCDCNYRRVINIKRYDDSFFNNLTNLSPSILKKYSSLKHVMHVHTEISVIMCHIDVNCLYHVAKYEGGETISHIRS